MAAYSAAAQLINSNYFRDPERGPQMPIEAEEAFRDFLVAALGMTREAAAERERDVVILATGLEPPELERRMKEWRHLLPPDDPSRSWEIDLSSSYQLTHPPPRS
jgi:hypothetical protein